jgi:hypothetical protein
MPAPDCRRDVICPKFCPQLRTRKRSLPVHLSLLKYPSIQLSVDPGKQLHSLSLIPSAQLCETSPGEPCIRLGFTELADSTRRLDPPIRGSKMSQRFLTGFSP